MSIPTSRDLARMRDDQERLQPDTVTITDPGTLTVESDGGTSITDPSSEQVIGRLVQSGTQAMINEFGAQIAAEADYVVRLPYGAIVREGWTVTVGSVEYTVIAVSKPRTWATTVDAALVSVTPIGG